MVSGADNSVVRREVLRFAIPGFTALLVLAGMVLLASRTGSPPPRRCAPPAPRTQLMARTAIEPALARAPWRDPQSVDAVVRDQLLVEPVVAIRLWRPNGRVVYATEPRLIGQRFALEDDARRILPRRRRGGRGQRPEQAGERLRTAVRRTRRGLPAGRRRLRRPVPAAEVYPPARPRSRTPPAGSASPTPRFLAGSLLVLTAILALALADRPADGAHANEREQLLRKRWTPPPTSGGASPPTSTTAWCRTSSASRSPSTALSAAPGPTPAVAMGQRP